MCHTPHKLTYRNHELADEVAERRYRATGLPIYVYLCACGNWHLTSGRNRVTEAAMVDVNGIGQLLGMSAQSFTDVLIRDLYGELTPAQSAIVQHSEVRDRYVAGLADLEDRTVRELDRARSTGPKRDLEYADQLERQIGLIRGRLAACRAMRIPEPADPADNSAVTSPEPVMPAEAFTAPVPLPETPAMQELKVRKQVRRTAGDRALERIRNRYDEEFHALMIEETRALGYDFTYDKRDLVGLTNEQIRELSPAIVDSGPSPRYPDVCLVLTGDETDHDIFVRLAGALYRYLRDSGPDGPERAAVALWDVARHMVYKQIRGHASVVNTAREWVTVIKPFKTQAGENT